MYMEQRKDFIVHGQESKVCKLDKFIYCLKQTHKQWNKKFDNLIMSKIFKVNESDKCIYYKTENGLCTIICLYVEEMLIFRSNLHVIKDVKLMLFANFDMKDLGEANVILSIKITRTKKETSLDQSYVYREDSKEVHLLWKQNQRGDRATR